MNEVNACILRTIYTRGAQVKSHGGPKIFLTYPRSKIDVLTHLKVVLNKESSKINQILGSEGQIKSFCGPHVVCCECLLYTFKQSGPIQGLFL